MALRPDDLRGGQTANDSFLGAIQASYQNLVYHPLAILFLFLSVSVFISTTYPDMQKTPFTSLITKMEIRHNDSFIVSRITARVISAVVKFIYSYETELASIIIVINPYIVKPSNRNLLVVLFVGFLIWIKNMSLMKIFVISQIIYLYVMVRAPAYKLVYLVIFILIYDFSYITNIIKIFKNFK